MLNMIVLTGRATQNPETKSVAKGEDIINITNVRIAVTKGKDDNNPLFIDVAFSGKTGEVASKYVHKGDLITIRGRLSSREAQDKAGNKHTYYGVYGDGLDLFPKTEKAEGEKPADDGLPF